MRKQVPQLFTPFVEVELYGPFGALQRGGDVADRQLFDLVQKDGGALAGRKRVHGGTDFIEHLALFESAARRGRRLRMSCQLIVGNFHPLIQGFRGIPVVARQVGVGLVHGHSHEPSRKFVQVLQPRQVAVKAHQAFHQYFINIIVIAQERMKKGIKVRLEKSAKFLKGIFRAGASVRTRSDPAPFQKFPWDEFKSHSVGTGEKGPSMLKQTRPGDERLEGEHRAGL